jgi:hypothetical protein
VAQEVAARSRATLGRKTGDFLGRESEQVRTRFRGCARLCTLSITVRIVMRDGAQ